MASKNDIVSGSASELARGIARFLRTSTKLEVPHTALRAAILQAGGRHPHASPKDRGQHIERPDGKELSQLRERLDKLEALIKQAPAFFHPGYDFDGKKLQWLQEAGLIEPEPSQPQERSAFGVTHTLYLVVDEDDGIERHLAFDEEGLLRVPEDFSLSELRLEMLDAQVPKVKRYGLPDYLSDPTGFFEPYGLKLGKNFHSEYKDTGDDSGDTASLEVSMPPSVWTALLLSTLDRHPDLMEEVSEWVGLHYGRNFDRESLSQQAQWLERFIETGLSSPYRAAEWAHVCLEWVYPDEDSDHVRAELNLHTGDIRTEATLPQDLLSEDVRVRIWVSDDEDCVGPGEGDDFALTRVSVVDSVQSWRLSPVSLAEVKELLGL